MLVSIVHLVIFGCGDVITAAAYIPHRCCLSTLLALGELVVHLGIHAGSRDGVDDVSNEADKLSAISELWHKYGQDAADARQHLHTIVESDDATIARIARDIVLIHNVHARRRDGTRLTATALAEQAPPVALIADGSRLEAHAVVVALTTHVVVDIAIQSLVS